MPVSALVLATTTGVAEQKGATVLCAVLAAGALVAPRERLRALATALALIATPVLLAVHRWNTSTFSVVRHHPAPAVLGALVALAALAGFAWLMHRRPLLFPLLAVAAVPFRVPVTLSGSTSNLLIPLYVVIAGGAVAWIAPLVRGAVGAGSGAAGPDAAPEAPSSGRVRIVSALLAISIVLYAAQSLYSAQFNVALGQVVFFYVPFALLFVLFARVHWDARLLRLCLLELVAIALGVAVIGFGELATRHLLLNPTLKASDVFGSSFRVNSLFYDPNIYGRFLALVALLLTAAMLWSRRSREVVLAGAALAVIWLGMVSSISQSSFVALLAGLVVLAALRFDQRVVGLVAGGAAVLGVVFLIAFGSVVHVDLGRAQALANASSGRSSLIQGGADLFAQRPLQGWGSGSFAVEYRSREASHVGNSSASSALNRAVAASHTIPITIATEQGIPGLLVYLALLAAALALLVRGARASPARAGLLAAFVALVVHTLLYADFLSDPSTWALLGVGAALAAEALASAPGNACETGGRASSAPGASGTPEPASA
jgi:O-antigen ligase